MSVRENAVSIEMALDVAKRQARDVLGIVPCHSGLPGWGRRPTTWCLLFRPDAAEPYCVTPYYEGDSEFGNGAYFRTQQEAQKHFVQRVRREWLDVKIYAEHGEEGR
jgi:hypothetical protein